MWGRIRSRTRFPMQIYKGERKYKSVQCDFKIVQVSDVKLSSIFQERDFRNYWRISTNILPTFFKLSMQIKRERTRLLMQIYKRERQYKTGYSNMQKSEIPDAKLSSSILERDIGNGERKPTNMLPSFFSNRENSLPQFFTSLSVQNPPSQLDFKPTVAYRQ